MELIGFLSRKLNKEKCTGALDTYSGASGQIFRSPWTKCPEPPDNVFQIALEFLEQGVPSTTGTRKYWFLGGLFCYLDFSLYLCHE